MENDALYRINKIIFMYYCITMNAFCSSALMTNGGMKVLGGKTK